MRKYCLLLIFMCLTFTVFAQTTWTVRTVPNTRVDSNEIHVSDPDGFLSDSAEMHINTALCAIRDRADVFVVTLSSIGSDGPKHFATALFNYWGIGDAETDNGVLLLFVEDQHALEFETGYGAESTLTDAKCERIFTQTILPCFRAGDYEGGLCAGVADIVTVFGGEVPDGLMTVLATSSSDSGSGDSDVDLSWGFILVLLFAVLMPIAGFVYWAMKLSTSKVVTTPLKTEGGATYVDGVKTSWSGSPWDGKGCLGALTIGLSPMLIFFLVCMAVLGVFPDLSERSQSNWIALIALLSYLTWVCFRQGRRMLKTADALAGTSINPKQVYQAAFDHSSNKVAMWMAPWLGVFFYWTLKSRIKRSGECQCPTCQAELHRDSSYALPDIHVFESRIEALDFHAYRCHNGHVIVQREKGRQYAKFTACEQCGAYASKKTDTEQIRAASYSQSGENIETYTCQYCGHVFKKTVVIPKLVHHYTTNGTGSSYSSSGRSYSSHSSHHSSGGSFGGGRSGGGGYSGRW